MDQNSGMLERPAQNSSSRGMLTGIFVVFFIALIFVAIWVSDRVFQPVVFVSEQSLSLQPGLTTAQAGTQLRQAGIIRDSFLFRLVVATLYPRRSIKAGTYTVSGSLNLVDAASLFVKGMPRKEVTMRIIEGWSIPDIADYLDKEGIVTKSAFLSETLKDYTARFPFLPPRSGSISLEGYLFPDTYRIFADSTPEDIITKLLENFRAHYTTGMERATRDQSRSMHNIVTLASILEREVKSDTDRRMVADIFFRRLSTGMPLQADSTINYITGKKNAQAQSEDLAIDSAYNTYRHKGLPPGPISNPGLSALQAALSPIKNQYWFFLTAPDGSVVYSKTFEEHVKNKIKYLSQKK